MRIFNFARYVILEIYECVYIESWIACLSCHMADLVTLNNFPLLWLMKNKIYSVLKKCNNIITIVS